LYESLGGNSKYFTEKQRGTCAGFPAVLFLKETQINNSHSLRVEHAFLRARDAADAMALLILLAECGQRTTQRMQEIHFFPSALLRFSRLIAWAGHCRAHRPQPTQALVA